jgi:hydroxymethylbilane synthase
VIVGTRGSRLAIVQAEWVVSGLRERFPDIHVSIQVIRTEGDRRTTTPVSKLGDKGIFVRAIERALLAGRIDLAVHSLKDVPADPEGSGLRLAAYPAREDPRDVLVSAGGSSLEQLPPGTRIGTGSLRRRVQLLERRDDLEPADIRGNVDTRLRRLDDGDYDAIVLAAAGLHRLDLRARITEYFSPEACTPDAGQGILALQIREGDEDLARVLGTLDDAGARRAAVAERAVMRALNADCRAPVGAYARVEGNEIRITAMAASAVDGPVRRGEHAGPADEAERVGRELGETLLRAISREP